MNQDSVNKVSFAFDPQSKKLSSGSHVQVVQFSSNWGRSITLLSFTIPDEWPGLWRVSDITLVKDETGNELSCR